MGSQTFVKCSTLDAPAGDVFRWHARPGAFARLTPPWERVEVVEAPDGLAVGSRVTLRTRVGPLRPRWVAEHVELEEGRLFRDVQVAGPFAAWDHTHRIEPAGPGASTLEDRIVYRLPLGALGRLVGGRYVRRKLERLFDYRHDRLARDLARHGHAPRSSTMRIAITGATGLVGSALTDFLTSGGHTVVRVTRGKATGRDVHWDPGNGVLSAKDLEGLDAVVHLAGENIAAGRWTDAQKERIRASRVEGTGLLCETLRKLEEKPKVLVCASAIGIYGDRGAETLDESSAHGLGFLAEVCEAWEAACGPARAADIRVVNARFGMVLSPDGGALKKMLLPFKLGVGGKIGSGDQWMSWVALDDVVNALHHALVTEELSGPVNVVAPAPVQNATYTKVLGRVLSRPTVLPLPAFAAKLALGEMAEELLLASQRVEPKRLKETVFRFEHPELEGALRHLLGRP